MNLNDLPSIPDMASKLKDCEKLAKLEERVHELEKQIKIMKGIINAIDV